MFNSKSGQIDDTIHIKDLPTNVDPLKKGKVNKGDNDMMPDIGSFGFY